MSDSEKHWELTPGNFWTEGVLATKKLITLEETNCQDLKRNYAHQKHDIPAGVEVLFVRMMQNMYGVFVVVRYKDSIFYLKPSVIKIV